MHIKYYERVIILPVGYLVVNVYVDNVAQPLEGANVKVEGENTNINVLTNISGKTDEIELSAPNVEYSLEPQTEIKPFSEYKITVTKFGMEPKVIEGVQIFPETVSIQNVFLNVKTSDIETTNVETIDEPTLWTEYPPQLENNEPTIYPKVLNKVIVPEYIVVHDGIPTNTSAPNYVVSFPDYVKNVASSEIYPTWPYETLKANIHAIVSFVLNRIYTEWYPSKGYNFTITSTTNYDQKYTPNRTIFNTISDVVDEYFTTYIRYQNQPYPYLAHYSDGIDVVRNGWLSQWGSKSLGDQGYNALQILKYYYGNDITLDNAEVVNLFPSSFPGYNLSIGACGEEVQKLQNELNKIHGSYPAIPLITNSNGIYDEQTASTVRSFQTVFDLPVTGVVDYATWYRISYIYSAISNMLKGIFE